MEAPMQKPNDLNQSRIVLKQDSTLIAVIEMSLSSWLVAGIVPGVERQPLKMLNRWREEAEKAGRRIERITVAFEAGRDGFWLARWLRARGIEAHVIHASSVAVSRERRRLVSDQIRQIEEARLERMEQAPGDGPHAMVRLIARVIGVGIETADMLVHEVLSRKLRDRRAVARYDGLTGAPDESWQQTARERARQGGQRTSTRRNDAVGLALFALSEEQCIGPVVSDS